MDSRRATEDRQNDGRDRTGDVSSDPFAPGVAAILAYSDRIRAYLLSVRRPVVITSVCLQLTSKGWVTLYAYRPRIGYY